MAHSDRRGGLVTREKDIYTRREKECLLVSFRKKPKKKKRTIFLSLLFSPLRFPLSSSLSKLDEMKRWQTEYICVRVTGFVLLLLLFSFCVCVLCLTLFLVQNTHITLRQKQKKKKNLHRTNTGFTSLLYIERKKTAEMERGRRRRETRYWWR